LHVPALIRKWVFCTWLLAQGLFHGQRVRTYPLKGHKSGVVQQVLPDISSCLGLQFTRAVVVSIDSGPVCVSTVHEQTNHWLHCAAGLVTFPGSQALVRPVGYRLSHQVAWHRSTCSLQHLEQRLFSRGTFVLVVPCVTGTPNAPVNAVPMALNRSFEGIWEP
jgi:hypothetical protein